MEEIPHRHIGVIVGITNGQRIISTGILISRNLVLTCAHTIYNHNSNLFFSNIQFYPKQRGPLTHPLEV